MNHRIHFPLPSAILLVGLLVASSAQAQLGISLTANRARYLRYEPIELTVALRNYSGNTLTFGKEGANRGYVFFVVDCHTKRTVGEYRTESNPAEGLILNPGETKELTVQLNQFFDMQHPSSYTVTAQAGHARLTNDYQSDPVTFEVCEGSVLRTQIVGLPGSEAATKIDQLKASLIVLRELNHGVYCLRVEDDTKVYGTVRLGRQIRGLPPEMDADGSSDIHLLLQVSARVYSYQVYSLANKRVKLRQERYYVADGGIPRLTRAPGYIKVVNGRPAVEGVDYKTDRKPLLPPAAPPSGGAGE